MNDHGITHIHLVSETKEQDIHSVVVQYTISVSSDYFDGHFPNFKLLPAVSQFDIIHRFAREYFSVSYLVPKVRRIKFTAMIRPDTTVQLEMTYKQQDKTISYKVKSIDDKIIYSSGAFVV